VRRLAFAVLIAAAGCGSKSAPPPGVVVIDQPATTACAGDSGDLSSCLFGTATAIGFTPPYGLDVYLYEVFPEGSEPYVQQQVVAADGTWAFSGLTAPGHYYVQLAASFPATADMAPHEATTVIGPLAVPSAGQPQMLQIGPVYATVTQSGAAGAQQVNGASAHVYDPMTGAELTNAAVNLSVGGASVPMPWDPLARVPSYRVTFDAGIPAQPAYTVSTSAWDAGAALVAAEPTFTGAITLPEAGASVATGALAVDFMPEPEADFEIVEVFSQSDAGWSTSYISPTPIPDNVGTTASLAGARVPPGPCLVNVDYVRANCVATGAGCVQAATIATETLTVTP
jgi:hypothetical protein